MELSNKSLALLLVSAIVISLGGTIVSLNRITEMGATGMAASRSGYVNLSITTNSSCIIDKSVDFGAGKPTTTRTLSSDANNNFDLFNCDGSSATSNCNGMVINNTGNVNLNISFNSTYNGTDLLGVGAVDSDFMWVADDTELEANSALTEQTVWQNVNKSTSNNSMVAGYLNFTDTSDVIVVDFNITIDQNTVPGLKQTTITVGCIAADSGA